MLLRSAGPVPVAGNVWPLRRARTFTSSRCVANMEASVLRIGLLERAEQSPGNGLWQRGQGALDLRLSARPVERPREWLARVNRNLKEEPLEGIALACSAGVLWAPKLGSEDGSAFGARFHLELAQRRSTTRRKIIDDTITAASQGPLPVN